MASTFYRPRKTVLRARFMIDKGTYNLFNYNCEHFAIWCKTCLTESTQLSIEGLAARHLRPKCGPLKWLANEIWRVEVGY